MPYKDPDKAREYRRRWDANRRSQRRRYDQATGYQKAKTRRASTVVFMGADGEGDLVGTRHEYLMLRAGGQLLDLRRPLHSEDCLAFLSSLPKGPTHVAFSFDYDATMMLRDLPEHVIGQVLDREARTAVVDGKVVTRKVKYKHWLIDYMPRKSFTVVNLKTKRHTIVHDTFGFFACKFTQALETWDIGTPEQRAQIEEGKDARVSLIAYGHDKTNSYNELECILAAELIQKLADIARELGYSISPYEGAGCLASSMLRKHLGHPPPLPPADVCRDAQSAYYGGWFEPLAHGQINRPVYEYDIASAYPHVMRSLPCLEHGTWIHTESRQRKDRLHLAHVTWKPKQKAYTPYGPLPHRDNRGIITRPLSGSGWYWSVEIPYDDPRWTFTVDQTWTYQKHCTCKPFDWVEPIYQERKKLGKTAIGMFLKLGLNSLYGKIAQSVGMAPWANPVWAGLITAMTRRMIYDLATDAMVNSGGAIHPIMFATDAVFFVGPAGNLPVDTSGALGSWEMKRFDSLHIIQAGMYFDDGGFKMRTRGIRAKALKDALPELRAAYERDGLAASIDVEYTQLLGIRLAYRQNRLAEAGNWFTVTKTVGYDYTNKRESVYTEDGITWSRPYQAREPFESVGYSKAIGGLMRDLAEEDALIDEADPSV